MIQLNRAACFGIVCVILSILVGNIAGGSLQID